MKGRKIVSIFLAVALVMQLFVGGISANAQTSYSPKQYKIWFDEPAGQDLNGFLTEALPLGNGYMGVNVFGGTDTELISVTENSMFNPYVNIAGGNELYAPSGEERPYYNNGGLNLLAKTYLDFGHTEVSGYTRDLSLNDAVASVNYDYRGVTYSREYFSTYPDKVTVIRLTASESGALTFTLRPEPVFINDYLVEPGDGYSKTGTATASGDTVTVKGTMDYFGINYEGMFKVIPQGGTMTANQVKDGTITVTGADSALILIAVGTNYHMTSEVFMAADNAKLDRTEDPHNMVQQYLDAAAAKSYDTLLQTHLADYQAYFNRADVDLGGELSTTITTDKMVENYTKGTRDPYMEELMFQYGRYMLIASSREGCLPSNLQGIWNFSDSSAWSSGYWHNINVQMNYWPAFNTDLAELFQSYVDYNEAFRTKAQANADSYLSKIGAKDMATAGTGGNGWAVGTGANPYYSPAPGTTGHSGPGTGAFTSLLFWDYYDFTRDTDILEEHTYSALEGMARFLSQTLEKQADGKWLVANSASPENANSYRTVGTAFDQQMVYENHLVTLKAAEALGYTEVDHPLLKTLREQIDHLDPVNIGYSGQIKEYREENYYGEYGEKNHRHISQLVGLYPGTSINGTTDAWLEAAAVTLGLRGDGSTGWSIAHRMLAQARIQDGDEAYRLLNKLLAGRTNGNMWFSYNTTKNSPFQIESHFGYTACVAEMLVQSHAGYIELLPALPSQWNTGSFEGLTTRGNFSVDATWANGKATKFVVESRAGSECVLKYPGIANATITDSKGNPVAVTKEGNNMVSFATQKGETYTVTGLASVSKVAAPGELTLAPKDGGVQLTWEASSDAVSYNVYRALNDEASYTQIATGITDTTYTYDAEDVKGTDRMTLRVTAVAANGQESRGSLAYSLPLGAPEQVTGTMFGTELQLEIQGAEAEGYRVYEDGVLKLETTLPVAVVPNADTRKTYTVSALSNGRESATAEVLLTVCDPVDNILLGKTLTLTGRDYAINNYPLSKAVDGNTTATSANERWAVSDRSDPYSVTADLGGVYKMGTLKIYEWTNSSESTRSDSTTVEVLNTEGQWQTVKASFSLAARSSVTVDMGGVMGSQIRFTFKNTKAAKSACIAEITCTGLKIEAVNKTQLYHAMEDYGDVTKPGVPVAYIMALPQAKEVLSDFNATQKMVDQATMDLRNAVTQENIFKNKAVTTTGKHINGYPISYVVDGDSTTRYAASASQNNYPQTITITVPLVDEYHLEAVFIEEFLDGKGTRPEAVQMEAYSDGKWTTVFSGKTLTPTQVPPNQGYNGFVLDSSVKASQVRFTFTHKNTSNVMTIYELQAYGTKASGDGVSLSSSRLTLTTGQTHQLTGSTAGTWSSSDPAVVSVDSTGKLTAGESGTATVTLKAADNKTAQCVVTVKLDTSELEAKMEQAEQLLGSCLPLDAEANTVITGVQFAPVAKVEALRKAQTAAEKALPQLSFSSHLALLIDELSKAISDVQSTMKTGTMADNHNHCTCGGALEHSYQTVKWTAWGDSLDEINSLPVTAGHYYLTADILLSDEYLVSKNTEVFLCLNGHDVICGDNQTYSASGTLNICDCAATPGTVSGGSTDQGGTLFVTATGILRIYGGVYTCSAKASDGGVLYVANGGKAYLYGGTVKDGSATRYGGNIHVVSGGTVEIAGTAITGGSADSGGANLYIGGSVTVSGGSVSGAKKGINALVANSGTLTVSGGVLEGSSNLNVRIWDSGNFTMSGGTLKATGYAKAGANIFADKGGRVTMTGGSVTGAADSDIAIAMTASVEGAVNAKRAAALTIRGGSVGSVYLADDNQEYDPAITFGGSAVIAKVVRGGSQKPVITFETLDSSASVTFAGETAGEVFGKGSSTDRIFSDGDLIAVRDGDNLKWSAGTFTVKFLHADNSEISVKQYKYGETVVEPQNPTKEPDETNSYTFAGWDKTVATVCVEDATYIAKFTPKAHSFDDACDEQCNSCGYTRSVTHEWKTAWAYNGHQHWKECSVCGDKKDLQEHSYQNGSCETCGVKETVEIVGDYTGDGEVTDEDVIYLLWHTVFPKDYPITGKADFTGDGEVTDEDVIYLLWHTVFPKDYPLER